MRPEPMVLRVDRIRCDGYGMCAELLPEMMDLDDWGFPIMRRDEVPPQLLDHARRAVAVCPVVALSLAERSMPARGESSRTRVPAGSGPQPGTRSRGGSRTRGPRRGRTGGPSIAGRPPGR